MLRCPILAHAGNMIKELTPLLVVDSIESQLPFWKDCLGYEVALSVPHGESLGFVGLAQGGHMVMLQTRASLFADMPQCARNLETNGGSVLYTVVDSLDETVKALKSVNVIQPVRETFYGMREIWVLDPSGNTIGFAERIPSKTPEPLPD